MHNLHKILVRLTDMENWDKDDVIAEARILAENATEDYQEQAFDWRETQTAGRWENKYPVNVLLSKNNIHRFVSELEECLEDQRYQMKDHLKRISLISPSLQKLVDLEIENGGSTPSYELLCLAELMYGAYTFDSCFYNTTEYTGKITRETIEEVKSSPKDWALVMFDYHI